MQLSEGSGVDMSYNGPPVPMYRPPSRGAIPYEEWRDDAKCSVEHIDVEFFMLNEEDSEDEQHEKVAEALAYCANCPVRQSCLTNSTPEDRYWSVRGGQPPEGLFQYTIKAAQAVMPKSQGGPGGGARGSRPKREPSETCKRGHNDWRAYKSGQRYCYSCKEVNNRKRYGGSSSGKM